MSKKVISFISIIAIIAVLAVVLYLLNRPFEQEQGPPSSAHDILYVLGGESPVSAREVRVSNARGGFTLIINETEYGRVLHVAGYEDFPVDQAAASVAASSERLIAGTFVALPGTDLRPFGLSEPACTAKITLVDDTEAALFIGSPAPGSDGYYVANGSGAVYLAGSRDVAGFFCGALDLLSKTITPAIPDHASFLTATLSGTVRPEPIVISEKKQEPHSILATHSILSPVNADLDQISGWSVVMTAFGFSARSVVGTYADIEVFGLDEPYSKLEITPTSDSGLPPFTLMSTRPDGEGNVILASSLTGLIYKLPADSLKWLEATAFELMAKIAVLPIIDTVSRVIVDTAADRFIFDLGADQAGALAVSYGEKAIAAGDFREFYRHLVSASYTSEAGQPLPADPALLLRITYEYRDPGMAADVVSFYEGGARRAFIVLNDGFPYYTGTAYIDSALNAVGKLVSG